MFCVPYRTWPAHVVSVRSIRASGTPACFPQLSNITEEITPHNALPYLRAPVFRRLMLARAEIRGNSGVTLKGNHGAFGSRVPAIIGCLISGTVKDGVAQKVPQVRGVNTRGEQ